MRCHVGAAIINLSRFSYKQLPSLFSFRCINCLIRVSPQVTRNFFQLIDSNPFPVHPTTSAVIVDSEIVI